LIRLVEVDGHLDRHVHKHFHGHRDRAGDLEQLLHRNGHGTGDENFNGHANGAGDLERLLDGHAHGVWHGAWDLNLPGNTALDGVWNLDGDTHREPYLVRHRDRHLVTLFDDNFKGDLHRVAARDDNLDRDTAWNSNLIRNRNRDPNLNGSTNLNSDGHRDLNWLADLHSDRDGNLDLDRGAHFNRNGDWHPHWCAHLDGDRDGNLNIVRLGNVDGNGDSNLDRRAHLNCDRHRNLNRLTHFDGNRDGNLDGNLVRDVHVDGTLNGKRNLDGNLDGNLVRLRNIHRDAYRACNHLLTRDSDGDDRTRYDPALALDNTAGDTVRSCDDLSGGNNCGAIANAVHARSVATNATNKAGITPRWSARKDSAAGVQTTTIDTIDGHSLLGHHAVTRRVHSSGTPSGIGHVGSGAKVGGGAEVAEVGGGAEVAEVAEVGGGAEGVINDTSASNESIIGTPGSARVPGGTPVGNTGIPGGTNHPVR